MHGLYTSYGGSRGMNMDEHKWTCQLFSYVNTRVLIGFWPLAHSCCSSINSDFWYPIDPTLKILINPMNYPIIPRNMMTYSQIAIVIGISLWCSIFFWSEVDSISRPRSWLDGRDGLPVIPGAVLSDFTGIVLSSLVNQIGDSGTWRVFGRYFPASLGV